MLTLTIDPPRPTLIMWQWGDWAHLQILLDKLNLSLSLKSPDEVDVNIL